MKRRGIIPQPLIANRRPSVGIYRQLFRYRESARRSPLEDFLSEALVDLLNRVPQTVQADFVSFIAAGRLALPDMADAGDMDWKWSTQRHILHQGIRGYIDILLEVDGRPLLVIENKIASPVRAHMSADEGGTGNQLRTYGGWLSSQAQGRQSALVLLSHTAAPPDDFSDPAASYGVDARNVVRWAALAAWLARLAVTGAASAWRDLAVELHEFLEEQDMTIAVMTQADLAGLEQFIPARERIEATFQRLWDDTADIRKGVFSRKVHPLTFDAETGSIWSWVYTAPPLPPSSWVALGIGFPSISSWWREAGLPDQRQFFISIGADDDVLSLDLLGRLPDGWAVADDQLTASLPFHQMPIEPEDMAGAMAAWAGGRMGEAVEILKRFIV